MYILSEKSKKEYPKSIIELLKQEENRILQDVRYFIYKIPKFIF
jgi:hypothetical protein